MAIKHDPLPRFGGCLRSLLDWIRAEGVPGVIIGGVAVSLLAKARFTKDVDAFVLLENRSWEQFLNRGKGYGFMPRVPDYFDFAREARVLLLRHELSNIDADISLGALPFEQETVQRALIVKKAGLCIPIPTPEDLIILKGVAHRDQDQIDIGSILDAHPNTDLRRVRRWLRDFASTLETPEILHDFEGILARRRRRKKRKG